MELSDRLSDVGEAEFSIFLAIHNPETSPDVFDSLNLHSRKRQLFVLKKID